MKHFYIILTCLFCVTVSFAQKQGNKWYFGQYAGLDFNSGTPVPILTGQLNTNEGCSSIADKKTGDLLFYTDGTYIWDRTNAIMPNGIGMGGNSTSTQSAVAIPQPGNDSIYYVFTVDYQAGIGGTYGGVSYNIVNMSLNGGLGDVSTLDQPLLTPTTEKVAATYACNDTDIWVVIHQWNTNNFYAYKITRNGMSAPVISSTGIIHEDVGSGQNAEAIGYLKFSPNGKMLALACYFDLNTVQLFNFDNVTGVVSSPVMTDTNYPNVSGEDGPYGVSFSPDNSKLYIGYFGFSTTPSQVLQYNLLAGNGAAILATRTVVDSTFVFGIGALQNGPDGKMYVAKENNLTGLDVDSLDIINNPNALGTACNYVNNALYLGGAPHLSSYGLPDIIENFLTPTYKANFSYTNCNGVDTLSLIDSTLTDAATYYWSFGDTASHTSDTSTLQNPFHTFSSPGTYNIQLILASPCKADTLHTTVTIQPLPVVTISPAAPIVCSGNETTITANGASTYQWSPSTDLSATSGSSVMASPTMVTTYSVIGTNVSGCTDTTSVIVNIGTEPTASFTITVPDICHPQTIQFLNTSTNDSTDYWKFGDGTTSNMRSPLHTYKSSGYYVQTLFTYSPSGCEDSVSAIDTVVTGEDFAIIPSAFTPGIKGMNSTFYANMLCKEPSDFMLRIYDRWGIMVFEATNPNQAWDGKYNGKDQPLGVYVYYLKFNCGTCSITRKGDITLVR